MDQIKTGKFIADERKKKGYTQRQLAEQLGISDKTISKWERGNGFPEISLLLPLCNELDLSVNELLTGERISEDRVSGESGGEYGEFSERSTGKQEENYFIRNGIGACDYCSYANVCGSGSISDGGLDADCTDCSRHSCHCDRHCDCMHS